MTCVGEACEPCTSSICGEAACSCKEGYSGTSCSHKICGPLLENECYGRGTCKGNVLAGETGTCECNDGYRGDTCKFQICPRSENPSLVLEECGGSTRGQCEHDSNGLNARCKCSDQYTGESCNLEMCFSVFSEGQRVFCYGNADEHTPCKWADRVGSALKKGKCNCKANFNEALNCKECLFGWGGPDCTEKLCVINGRTDEAACGHGSCDFTTGLCKCNDRYFYDEHGGCTKKSCLGSPHECNNRGECNNETGICQCHKVEGQAKFYGEACEYMYCPKFEDKEECGGSNRGSCNKNSGVCTCKSNFDGENCGHCSDKNYGEDCAKIYLDCPSWTPPNEPKAIECGGFGTCNNKTGTCICDHGTLRTGEDCKSILCFPPEDPLQCSGDSRGDCDLNTGKCVCKSGEKVYFGEHCEKTQCRKQEGQEHLCNHIPLDPSRNENYCDDSKGACMCKGVWTGIYCEVEHCKGYNLLEKNEDCFGRGVCNDEKKCVCGSGSYGELCEKTVCGGLQIPAPNPLTDTSFCNARGTCLQLSCDNFPGYENKLCLDSKCVCNSGFKGETCEHRICPSDPDNPTNECFHLQGHGTCNGETGECNCHQEYETEDKACGRKKCKTSYDNPEASSPRAIECGGRGKCIADLNSAVCKCNPGWEGERCERKSCPTDLVEGMQKPCAGRGVCEAVPDDSDYNAVIEMSCKCPANWDKTNDCKTCVQGYKTPESNCDFAICYDAEGKDTDCGESEGRGTCVVGVCKCQGLFYDQVDACKKKHCEVRDCNGRGDCTIEGTCVCRPDAEGNEEYHGDNCELKSCPKYSDKYCGGVNRGVCDTATGTCSCKVNYSGDNCGECSADYRGEQCEHFRCLPAWSPSESASPEECGGPSYGTCNTEIGECICNDVERLVDKQCKEKPCAGGCNEAAGSNRCDRRWGQCICESRFSGTNCEVCTVDCNSGSGSKISNICNPSTGKCVCGNVWSGEDCKTENCVNYNKLGSKENCLGRGVCGDKLACQCTGSYWGSYCQNLMCPGSKRLSDNSEEFCSGNGVCEVDSCNIENTLCSVRCKCDDGFYGGDCSLQFCPGDIFNQCFVKQGHGTCNTATGKCQCNVGYFIPGIPSTTCEQKVCPLSIDSTGKYSQCGGRGKCIYDWHNIEIATCECDPLFEGEACERKKCPLGPNGQICSGKGSCKFSVLDGQPEDSLQIGICLCYELHDGNSCELNLCAPRGEEQCGGRGECSTGTGTCICDKVAGEEISRFNPETTCKTCIAPYHGEQCEIKKCHGFDENNECNIKKKAGTCVDGTCRCTDRFEGLQCLRCSLWFEGEDCELIKCPGNGPEYCGSDEGRGSCDRTKGVCNCNGPYFGTQCELKKCEPDCQNGGSCIYDTGECSCVGLYFGSDCTSKNCVADCNSKSGRGSCLTTGIFAGSCMCNPPFYGTWCENKKCPNNCNNHGACSIQRGICTCDEGWDGADCSIRVCSPPCQHGTCNDFGSGTYGQCSCEANWEGDACHQHKCMENCRQDLGVVCSKEDGTCVCDNRVTSCIDVPCPGVCQNGGSCNRDNGQCVCDPNSNFHGTLCGDLKCPLHLGQPCGGSARGFCQGLGSSYSCSCINGYYGPACGKFLINRCFL